MSETYPALSGPDQLDNLATAAEANGLHINAETFNQLARDWRQLQADYDRAQLRIAEQSHALDRAREGVSQSAAALKAVA
jgi:hypothetical protein